MLEKINTEKAPRAIGPYSQAVKVNNMLFTSGQIPLDPETMEIVGVNVKEQAERVMQNLNAVLEEAGVNFDHVVKTTCFLKDMGDFAEFNEIYSKYIKNAPARSCVAVRELPKDVLCEVEVIAYL